MAFEPGTARLVFTYEMTVLPQSSGGTAADPPRVPVAYRIPTRDRITIMMINTAIIPLFSETDGGEVLSFLAMSNHSSLL